ncbi:MAG: PAS sensor protein [Myxococcota bacterium]|jgi:transcriptional regulator with PAS, ATPase and Fis domain|nr:PAS sensor protein [Myxococcota bacterium]
MNENAPWMKELSVAITVIDAQGTILDMNDKAALTFSKWGGSQLVGQSVLPCHSPRSRESIEALLRTGGANTYTIEKAGARKLIHQCAWTKDGQVAGLVELSIELPEHMPHHVRPAS